MTLPQRKKPRLTDKVLRGLKAMATLTEAGTCDDLTGNPESDPESRKVWQDALAACDWVHSMTNYRKGKREVRE